MAEGRLLPRRGREQQGLDTRLGIEFEWTSTHRPLSSSLSGLPYKILNMNPKTKELLRGLWVGNGREHGNSVYDLGRLWDGSLYAVPEFFEDGGLEASRRPGPT